MILLKLQTVDSKQYFLFKVAHNDNLDIISDAGGPVCPPSKPLEFRSNIQQEDYKFEEDPSQRNCISGENLLEKLPFLLSRFGLPNHILEHIKYFENDVEDNTNGIYQPQKFYNNNEDCLKKYGSARYGSEEIPRELNTNLKEHSR